MARGRGAWAKRDGAARDGAGGVVGEGRGEASCGGARAGRRGPRAAGPSARWGRVGERGGARLGRGRPWPPNLGLSMQLMQRPGRQSCGVGGRREPRGGGGGGRGRRQVWGEAGQEAWPSGGPRRVPQSSREQATQRPQLARRRRFELAEFDSRGGWFMVGRNGWGRSSPGIGVGPDGSMAGRSPHGRNPRVPFY